MGRPVGVVRIDRLAGALVEGAGRQLLHGDAVLDRADVDAEIAADAFLFHHLEMTHAVDELRDRLMRGVLAGDVAAAAFDAGVLVDLRLGDVVEVQILPVGDVRNGAAGDVVEVAVALGVHPVGEAR